MKGRTNYNKNIFQKTDNNPEHKMDKPENQSRTHSEKKLHKHVLSDSEKISSYESMRTDSGCSSISLSSSSQFSIDSGMFDSASSISLSKLSVSFEKTLSTDEPSNLPDSEVDEKWGYSTVIHDSGVISDFSSTISETETEPKQTEKMVLKDINDSFLWKEIFRQDHDGDTLLHIAVIKGSLGLVKSFVQVVPHPDFLDILNDLHQTPLHLAILTGQPKIARILVVAGATVDLRDRHGNTPLHIACKCGDICCVQALISQIDNKEIEQLNVQYPLYQQYISTELLELRNYEGQTCIHISTVNGYKKIIEYLVKCGADINAQEGKSGKTALHYAVETQKLDLVRFLLSTCKANINMRNYAGQTPLSIAWKTKSATSSLSNILSILKFHGGEQYDVSESETDSDESLQTDEDSDETETDENIHSAYNDIRICGQPL